jgi:hypothetical protein
MTAGFFGRVPRVALLVAVALLATATLTLAANSTVAPATPPAPQAAIEPQTLVVPDVRRQAYVFAKGTLEQSGFAWRVEGSVKGYAANVVTEQTPAPGAKVVGNGAPIVVLRLSANGSYKQEGSPENVSPYAGRPARLVGAKRPAPKTKLEPAKQPPTKPAKKVVAAKPKPAAPPTAKPVSSRNPAFVVKGAPKEPRDEISLAARAQRLAKWLETHKRRTPANVNHWLYQHNWIVTGARFGWSHGAEALRTLVEVDERVQALWGVGARSEQVARAALAEVEKSSR